MRFVIMLVLIACLTTVSSVAFCKEHTVTSPAPNQMMGYGWGWSGEKSPGVAALLSLQPMPVALGDFYVDNWRKGILYTSLELGLFVPGVMLMSNHSMGRYQSDDNERWTDSERITFYSLLTGYIAVKIISAYDAASTAEKLTHGNNISFGFEPESHTGMAFVNIRF